MSPFKWIHSLVIAAATALAVMGGVTSANAAIVTFDFAQMAIDFGEQAFDNTAGYATVNGITIQVTAFGNAASQAYLDAPAFGGKKAGLGVCSSGVTANQCNDSSDDNVSPTSSTPGPAGIPEMLRMEFFSDTAATNQISVVIRPTFFRNAIHETDFPASALIDIAVDGVFAPPFPLVNNFTTPLGPGMTFDFRYNNEEFYISSLTVPVPAALPLFLSALAGLALVGRRRKKAAA